MVISSIPHLQQELERQVSVRTGRRVRNLTVELDDGDWDGPKQR